MSDFTNEKNQSVSKSTHVSDVEEPVANVTKEERLKKRVKLPFGHYKVNMNCYNDYSQIVDTEVVCKPLTQDDYAHGWQTVLPRPRKGRGNISAQPIHHWSVTLAQLPPHLWRKLRTEYDEDGKPFHPVIRDNIYHYTVSASEHDENLHLLNEEIMKGRKADKTIVKDLVNKLDTLNSWLVLQGRRFCKGTLDMDVSYA
jgi:hypothetical protein